MKQNSELPEKPNETNLTLEDKLALAAIYLKEHNLNWIKIGDVEMRKDVWTNVAPAVQVAKPKTPEELAQEAEEELYWSADAGPKTPAKP